MADDLPQVGAEAVLIHDQYDRDMADVIKKADELDRVFNDLGGEINASINLDTSEIDNLEPPDVLVDVSVDDSEVVDEIDNIEAPDIEASVTADIDDAEQSLLDLEAEAPTVEGTATLDDTEAQQSLLDLDKEEVKPQVNLKETDQGKQVANDVKFLASLKKMDIVIDFGKQALQFIETVGKFSAQPLLDINEAASKIRAQTGDLETDWDHLVNGIWRDDLGTSIDQITGVVIAADNMHAPIDEATRAALTFTHTFTEQDPTAVLTTMNQTVGELFPTFSAAGDALTVAFQNGANRAGDLLSTLNQNATAFKDLGLDGNQALSLITTGLDNGFASASDVALALTTFKKNLTTGGEDVDAVLKAIGLDNPTEKGQEVGADFLNAVIEGLKNAPDTGAMSSDEMAAKLFGKQGIKNTSAVLGLDTETGTFDDLIGASEDAATEIDNNLSGAIDDFMLAAQVAASDFLSSDQIDLPGKIDAIKKGLQDALDVLSKGGTLGEALEIGLHIEGVDTFISNFERIVGNLEIAFLQVVASIQDITGHGKEAEGTRATIKNLAQGQLAFDLQVANPDEVSAQVQQAFSRGLSADDVGAAITTALNEGLAKGNFEQGTKIIQGLIDGAIANGASPEAAQKVADTYVGQLQDQFANALDTGNLDLVQKLLAIDPNAKIPGLDESVTGFKQQLADAFTPQDRVGDQGNPFTSGMFAGPGKQLATNGGLLGSIKQDVADATTQITTAQTSIQGLDTATDTATTNMASSWSDLNVSLTEDAAAIVTTLDSAAAKIEELDARSATALTENTVTASFDAVAESAAENFQAVMQWMDMTGQKVAVFDVTVAQHLNSVNKMLNDLNFLALQTIANVIAAQALGGSGGVTNTTNNVNVTNNNSNGAQTSNSQYQLNEMLGGK